MYMYLYICIYKIGVLWCYLSLTDQSTVFIIRLCPSVKEPGRIEKKNRLERRGKSRKAR